MEALNDYFKKGGVLKFSTGGGFERYIENSRIKKGRFGLKMESPETDNLDLFGMSEYHGYTPT